MIGWLFCLCFFLFSTIVPFLKQIYKYSRKDGKKSYDTSLTKGLAGEIWPDEANFVEENAVVPSPIPGHLAPLHGEL